MKESGIPETEQLILWITVASVVSAVATLIAIPWVVTRLPSDYFDHSKREVWRQSQQEPVTALVLGVLKNAVGAVLLVLGLVMLFTPGQGVLTILVGLMLMNFPGKYRLERWLVRKPGVLKSLNWLRERRSRPPFTVP